MGLNEKRNDDKVIKRSCRWCWKGSENKFESCKDLTFHGIVSHRHRKRAPKQNERNPLPSERRRPIVCSFHSQSVASANSQLSTWCHCNYPSAVKTMIKCMRLLTHRMLSHYFTHAFIDFSYSLPFTTCLPISSRLACGNQLS